MIERIWLLVADTRAWKYARDSLRGRQLSRQETLKESAHDEGLFVLQQQCRQVAKLVLSRIGHLFSVKSRAGLSTCKSGKIIEYCECCGCSTDSPRPSTFIVSTVWASGLSGCNLSECIGLNHTETPVLKTAARAIDSGVTAQ